MPVVTGLTSARMAAIEAAAVVSGAVVGGNLILTKQDGTTINAGSVIGPTGPAGSGIQSVTSGTRPASPTAGQLIWESDTKELLQYQTATTGWTRPWSIPWGEFGYAEITANQASITTVTDVTGLTLTKTVVANRIIEVRFELNVLSTVATDVAVGTIADGANTVKSLAYSFLDSQTTMNKTLRETTTAGSLTRKVRMQRQSGTGTLTVAAAATLQAFIKLVDMGPSAAPA